MRMLLLALLTSHCVAAESSPEAAAAAKAGWPDELRQALGFENAAAWDGGEAVTEPRHGGDGAVRWARHQDNGSLVLRRAPLDLGAFNTVSFWVHSSDANGETFMILAESQREEGVFSYYSRKFTVDWTGWKQLTAHFGSFGSAREPAGWDQITRFRFTATGWDQAPRNDSVWVFDDLDFSFDPKPYRPDLNIEFYVDAPPATAWREQLRPGHPRLILLDDELPRIRQLIADDPVCADWYESVLANADSLTKRPVSEHVLPDGKRLLGTSREVLKRVYHWGFCYRLDGDRKWLDRTWEELSTVVAFPDWNPSHYLDTAEMMHAVAIGYDWFYNDWTEAQRQTLREGLWQHGLRLSHAAYLGLKAEGQQHWKGVTNNWNFVCNGGSALAAMALLDELPDECTPVLDAAYQYNQVPLHGFEPDGAWWEGIGYWGYSMRYLCSYLRGLETSFGTDFGFVDALADTGFAKTGDFPIYLTSPSEGYFNFADSGSGGSGYQHWAFFYLANQYGNPLYQYYQRQNGGASPENLIYYQPFEVDVSPNTVALDRHFRGAEIATMRGSWTDPNAVFLGIKSGRNGIAHAHQDLGSFAFYDLGEKWIMDLGTEGQTYQAHKHHIPSWQFYRIRAEGHNTLVFNPAHEDSQDRKAASRITRFESTPNEALAVVDLSAAYPADAESVVRGFRLLDQRRALLIQDEITAAKPNDVWWFAHGDSGTKMTVGADGREVVLERHGKLCRATLLSPAGARLEVMPARPLPTSPDPEIQQQNQGIQKLAVHLPNTQNTTISVLFTTRYGFEPESTVRPAVQPIADWPAPVPAARLTTLNIGGEPLPNFSPEVFTYSIELPDEVTAPPGVGATGERPVEVEPAATVPGTTRVRVGDSVYQVRFLHPPAPGSTDKAHVSAEPVTVNGVTVMASRHDGNLPRNVLDEDPETRWSASGDNEWLAFGFGEPRRLEVVRIDWYQGDQRRSKFELQTSDDAKTWRTVWSGESSGEASGLETFELKAPVEARYLRILGHGNSANLWNSIETVRFER